MRCDSSFYSLNAKLTDWCAMWHMVYKNNGSEHLYEVLASLFIIAVCVAYSSESGAGLDLRALSCSLKLECLSAS